jgi:uncharacterized protein (TIGR02679 family)
LPQQAAVRAALGRPELERLWRAARHRLEAGGTTRSFSLRAVSETEAAAIAELLGAARQARGTQRVSLEKLDRALLASRYRVSLREVLEILSGPLRDRSAERAAVEQERASVWLEAREHPAVTRHPQLAGWLADLRRSGALVRSARATGVSEETLLRRALDVLVGLPASGVSLPVLAAEVTGDAHALDADQPLAGLVLRAGARLLSVDDLPTSAAGRRHLWASLGVLCDPLSAHALLLNLRASGDGLVARQLRGSADAGEPRRLTLRELRREPLPVASGTEVFVCENPGIVAAAADRLGQRCAALICTEGMPSTAVMELLAQLAGTGAVIRVHVDFDWGGIRIANYVAAQLGAMTPWRLSRTDYEQALTTCREAAPLCGEPAEATWDPELTQSLAAAGMAILEEHMLDLLLGDLERSDAGSLV